MRNGFKVLSVLVAITGVMFLLPADAQARDRRHRDSFKAEYKHHKRPHYALRYHHARPFGQIVFSIPHGAISIGFGRDRCFFHRGNFYRPHRGRYMVVPPPAGALTYALPGPYEAVVIDGVTYYMYNGTYYTRVPNGYQIVQPPARLPAPVTVMAGNASDDEEVFTVNIPLSSGGYKAVIIRRDGEGFQGPQGEFYAQFPRVEQLRAMYAKN